MGISPGNNDVYEEEDEADMDWYNSTTAVATVKQPAPPMSSFQPTLNLKDLSLSDMLQNPEVCNLYERNAKLLARQELLLDKTAALEKKVEQLEAELRNALVNAPASRPVSRYVIHFALYIYNMSDLSCKE